MEAFTLYVSRFGLPLIFDATFCEQIGVPIPAIPILIVVGALSVGGDVSFFRLCF